MRKLWVIVAVHLGLTDSTARKCDSSVQVPKLIAKEWWNGMEQVYEERSVG